MLLQCFLAQGGWRCSHPCLSELGLTQCRLEMGVCLYLKFVSCRQHIVGSCFSPSPQPENLCLSIEVSRPFIVNIIIDMIGFKSSILLVVSRLFYTSLISSLFFCLFLLSFSLSVFYDYVLCLLLVC